MNWTNRLNDYAAPIPFAEGVFEIIGWAYAAALADNLPHRHTFYEVCLVGEYGAGVFTVGDTKHSLEPGTLFFARPGIKHRIQNTQTPLMELLWVTFSLSLKPDATGETARLCREFETSESVMIDATATPIPALWNLLRRLGEGENTVGTQAQIEGVARALLLGLLQAGSDELRPASLAPEPRLHALPVAVRLALRYLQDNLERPLTVEETAQQAGVTSRHLARLFAEHVGVSPSDYLERTRLDRASGLLRRTDLPIKEIAARTGFSSVHYFTRRFHHLYGASPGAYRDADSESHVRIVQKEGALV